MPDIASPVAAVASAVAAIAALIISHKALAAARSSADTAGAMTRIETDRRHDELAPTIEIHKRKNADGWIQLVNPKWLPYEVSVTVVWSDGYEVVAAEGVVVHARGEAAVPAPELAQGPDRLERLLLLSMSDVRLVLRYRLAEGVPRCPCHRPDELGHWRDDMRQIPRDTDAAGAR